jgi:hypothetical protein
MINVSASDSFDGLIVSSYTLNKTYSYLKSVHQLKLTLTTAEPRRLRHRESNFTLRFCGVYVFLRCPAVVEVKFVENKRLLFAYASVILQLSD